MADDFRFGISGSVRGVDLNQLLVSHPVSTFFMRVAEDLPSLDLLAADILMVDRSLLPKKNDLVVVGGEDPELRIIRFSDMKKESLELWGTVVHLIRKVKI